MREKIKETETHSLWSGCGWRSAWSSACACIRWARGGSSEASLCSSPPRSAPSPAFEAAPVHDKEHAKNKLKNKWINLLTVFYFIQATTPVCRKHACSSDERLVLVTPWKSDPYLTVCHFRQSDMGQLWFAPNCNNQQQARSAAEAGGFD